MLFAYTQEITVLSFGLILSTNLEILAASRLFHCSICSGTCLCAALQPSMSFCLLSNIGSPFSHAQLLTGSLLSFVLRMSRSLTNFSTLLTSICSCSNLCASTVSVKSFRSPHRKSLPRLSLSFAFNYICFR